MTPKLIKLASGDTLYANQDLIKFIKQTVAQTSDSLKPDDNLYFFKDVNFRRDLLSVSAEKFNRVILMTKATAVIINSNIEFPYKALVLKNNKIDANCPEYEADDILYNISQCGVEYVTTMEQWYQLSQLTIKPRIVFENVILEHVNSGIVINADNYEQIIMLEKTDANTLAGLLNTCNIKDSINYIIYILYFKSGFLQTSTLLNSMPNIRSYLSGRGSLSRPANGLIMSMLSDPFLKDLVTADVIKRMSALAVSGTMNMVPDFTEWINIDIKWKTAN